MARYKDAVCKLCRREGEKLYLKGQRCHGAKCAWERKPHPPGQAGEESFRSRPRKPSEYALQLREKQKCRHIYGVLERQFRRYVSRAMRVKGVTGEMLLRLLETRMDNAVYRAGMAASRPQARQLVRHRHFTVNGRVVDIPSYSVRVGDEIEVRPASRKQPPFVEALNAAGGRTAPSWMSVDWDQFRARVEAEPTRADIDTRISEQVIVEFYSR